MATKQQCVPATGEASSASAPATDDTARSAWLSVNTHATYVSNNNNNNKLCKVYNCQNMNTKSEAPGGIKMSLFVNVPMV